jgi:hypothetical protein
MIGLEKSEVNVELAPHDATLAEYIPCVADPLLQWIGGLDKAWWRLNGRIEVRTREANCRKAYFGGGTPSRVAIPLVPILNRRALQQIARGYVKDDAARLGVSLGLGGSDRRVRVGTGRVRVILHHRWFSLSRQASVPRLSLLRLRQQRTVDRSWISA